MEETEGPKDGNNLADMIMAKMNAGDFIDNVSMKLPDLDIERVAVKSGDKKVKNANIPPDKMIRYNFLEIWIRLASQKYIK